jgi:hypothetical protein
MQQLGLKWDDTWSRGMHNLFCMQTSQFGRLCARKYYQHSNQLMHKARGNDLSRPKINYDHPSKHVNQPDEFCFLH